MTAVLASEIERTAEFLAASSAIYSAVSNDTRQLAKTSKKLQLSPSPGSMPSHAMHPHAAIEERLFDARAAAKVLTASVAMHLDSKYREKLFAQIDSLHDADEWPEGDEPLLLESFSVFLRVYLDLQPHRNPSLGLAPSGNLLAAWIRDEDRLYLEFLPMRRVRWSLSRGVGKDTERAAGEAPTARLRAVLSPYDIEHWLIGDEGR
jgi:hypothetical protein